MWTSHADEYFLQTLALALLVNASIIIRILSLFLVFNLFPLAIAKLIDRLISQLTEDLVPVAMMMPSKMVCLVFVSAGGCKRRIRYVGFQKS